MASRPKGFGLTAELQRKVSWGWIFICLNFSWASLYWIIIFLADAVPMLGSFSNLLFVTYISNASTIIRSSIPFEINICLESIENRFIDQFKLSAAYCLIQVWERSNIMGAVFCALRRVRNIFPHLRLDSAVESASQRQIRRSWKNPSKQWVSLWSYTYVHPPNNSLSSLGLHVKLTTGDHLGFFVFPWNKVTASLQLSSLTYFSNSI